MPIDWGGILCAYVHRLTDMRRWNRWDVTISMVSREDTVLPYSYFESLLRLEDTDTWSFFDITGCPRELFVRLVQLTHMAAEKEKLAEMRFASFRYDLVDEIEEAISAWKNNESDDMGTVEIDDENSVHDAQDKFHCYKAWQFCLLLYIHRVFRWDRTQPPSPKIKMLARRTLDHIQSCRLSSLISKQVLLPIFLAGSEILDNGYCEMVGRYCREWHRKSGYQPFIHVLTLLESVWNQRRATGSNSVWWGSVIDETYEAFGEERLKLG